MYRKFKPPFFWPEQYRRTGELSIFFLFDENPGVAFAGRWAPQGHSAVKICQDYLGHIVSHVGVETRGKSGTERQHGLSQRSELACFQMRADYNRAMATIAEIEKLARDLSEKERAVLAAHLLGSLPPVLHDEDDGIAEALRRDAEIEANPSASLSLEQLDQQIARRRT